MNIRMCLYAINEFHWATDNEVSKIMASADQRDLNG